MAALSQSAGLFEVSVPRYQQLKACHREVRLLKELWDMIVLVSAVVCELARWGGQEEAGAPGRAGQASGVCWAAPHRVEVPKAVPSYSASAERGCW